MLGTEVLQYTAEYSMLALVGQSTGLSCLLCIELHQLRSYLSF
jgi:hypothetical protein